MMFYLVDPAENREVVASHTTIDGYDVNGFRVVSLPDYAEIDETDRSQNGDFLFDTLIQQKYDQILAQHPIFSSVHYDDLTDASGFTNDSDTRAGFGSDVFWVSQSSGQDGLLRTTSINVGGVDRMMVQWDLYSLARTKDGSSLFVRYVEEDPDLLDVTVTDAANGSNAATVNNEEIFELPSGTANDVEIEFLNTQSDRYYIGGYCILY